MIHYLRIPKNKFWGWVFSSLVVGLVLGAGAAWVVSRTSSAKQIDDLKGQLASQTSRAASSVASLQSRLDSLDTSLTTVSQQYEQLKADNASANTSTSDKNSSSSTTSQTVELKVMSRSISPSTIATGDYITMRATVQGDAVKVTMRIIATGTGSSLTYSLNKSSTDGSTSTWKRTVRGPKATGTYRYYATVYSDTNSATMPGAAVSTFKVE